MMCNAIYSNNISVISWLANEKQKMVEYSSYFSVITSFGDHQRLVCEKQDLNHLVVLCWLTVSF